jgi:hypothetical protein
MKRIVAPLLLLASVLAGCVHTTPKDLSKFKEANPTSILVVPVVNETVEVTAPDYFLSTVSVPLAERGYYVFPVNLVKRMLEDEGLSDASLVHSAPAGKVCNLFGSDSILYVTIKEWNAQYMVLSTTVNLGLHYAIKDCKSGETLWEHDQKMTYTPQSSNTGHPLGNLIAMAITAAIEKASPNYIPLARQANALVFNREGVAIPPGPYATPEGEVR